MYSDCSCLHGEKLSFSNLLTKEHKHTSGEFSCSDHLLYLAYLSFIIRLGDCVFTLVTVDVTFENNYRYSRTVTT